MAAYFLITILALVLTPMTLSSINKRPASMYPSCRIFTVIVSHYFLMYLETHPTVCQCQACIEQRARIAKREKSSILALNLSKKYDSFHSRFYRIDLSVGHIFWLLVGRYSHSSAIKSLALWSRTNSTILLRSLESAQWVYTQSSVKLLIINTIIEYVRERY